MAAGNHMATRPKALAMLLAVHRLHTRADELGVLER